MQTIDISPSEMARRVARYAELDPLDVQKNTNLSQEAADIVWARKLLSVVGLEEDTDTPINSAAPIKGAAGITITLAQCPPGTGPSLHAHQQTFETFTVMKGRFEVYWNDTGENRLELISMTPFLCPRASAGDLLISPTKKAFCRSSFLVACMT